MNLAIAAPKPVTPKVSGTRALMNFKGKDFANSEIHFFETMSFKRNAILKSLRIRFLISFRHYGKSTGLGLEKTWVPILILLHISYVYREVNKFP